MLIRSFDSMNDRLPTANESAHFWAEPSRDLIQSIEIIYSLFRSLKNSEFSFSIDEYYKQKIDLCKTFLRKSGGSAIPPNMEKIELYYKIPIFFPRNSIVIDSPQNVSSLKLIGEGSYAQVFKYADKFYLKKFALKRAKSDLNKKEQERFKREYEQMKSLSSPYVVEVFCYDEKKKEYVMEFMDHSLEEYIAKKNTILSFKEKLSLGSQIIKAFSYIHSKNILHRDISPRNILLKQYEDVVVVKISDFGLVKMLNSNLTSLNTDFKGYFNDPGLAVEGFDNYGMSHETYALTRILYYVLTGRTSTKNVSSNVRDFVDRGLNSDESVRFKGVVDLKDAFYRIKPD